MPVKEKMLLTYIFLYDSILFIVSQFHINNFIKGFKMLTIEQIKIELARPVWNKAQVARESGVTYKTLMNFFSTENPGYQTVKKLSDFLESEKVGASADES